MHHPETPVFISKKNEGKATEDVDTLASESLGQAPTASTSTSFTDGETTDSKSKKSGSGDSPDSKSSPGSVLLDDPNYIPPNKYDILLTDVTDEYLTNSLPDRLGVQYLTPVENTEDEIERCKTDRKLHGKIVGWHKRFLINVPIRREIDRNDPSNPKKPLPFINVFFLVDTGSPASFISYKVMEELCGGNKNNRNPLPGCLDVQLITGNSLELHLSPPGSHFSGVNLLGGTAMNIADIISNNRQNKFVLEFNQP